MAKRPIGLPEGIRSSSLELTAAPAHVVQVCPADFAEGKQWIGIEAFGQSLSCELPELDTRLQSDLDDGSENRLRSRTTSGGANSLIRLISPIRCCSSLPIEISSFTKAFSNMFDASITKSA